MVRARPVETRNQLYPMSDNEQPIEWFLARDGQQHGPLTDREIHKLVELGHLRVTDLVWRQGFADWRPAPTVFAAPAPRPAPPGPAAPAGKPGAARAPSGEGPAGRPAWDSDLRSAMQRADPALYDQARSSASAPPGPSYARGPAQAGAYSQPHSATSTPHSHPHSQPRLDPRLHPGVPGSMLGPGAHGSSPRDLAADDDPDGPGRRLPWLKIAAVLFLAVVLGAGTAFYAKGRISLTWLPWATNEEVKATPVVRAPTESPKQAVAAAQPETPAVVARAVPSGPFGDADVTLQRSMLWQVLKREFPDWYRDRTQDAARLPGESTDEKALSVALTPAVIKLRRENAAAALAASPARLRSVATAFVDNLDRLAKHSTQACYGFISGGESDPTVMGLMRGSELAAPLQAQLVAIFEAIADGRKSPKQHGQAQRADFDTLATHLGQRGWGPQDLQLFSDARALARAAPERVCKMVQDWFAAQLAVKDEAIQLRLLVETLKPVIAG